MNQLWICQSTQSARWYAICQSALSYSARSFLATRWSALVRRVSSGSWPYVILSAGHFSIDYVWQLLWELSGYWQLACKCFNWILRCLLYILRFSENLGLFHIHSYKWYGIILCHVDLQYVALAQVCWMTLAEGSLKLLPCRENQSLEDNGSSANKYSRGWFSQLRPPSSATTLLSVPWLQWPGPRLKHGELRWCSSWSYLTQTQDPSG